MLWKRVQISLEGKAADMQGHLEVGERMMNLSDLGLKERHGIELRKQYSGGALSRCLQVREPAPWKFPEPPEEPVGRTPTKQEPTAAQEHPCHVSETGHRLFPFGLRKALLNAESISLAGSGDRTVPAPGTFGCADHRPQIHDRLAKCARISPRHQDLGVSPKDLLDRFRSRVFSDGEITAKNATDVSVQDRASLSKSNT